MVKGFDSRQEQGISIFKIPDPLMGPPSLPFTGYQGAFLRAYSDKGVRLTNHL